VERAAIAAASADGRLDLQSALVYALVVITVAVIVNLWVRRHVPRRERRARYGADEARRDGAVWNHAPWDAYRRWRSQLHDGSGAGPGRQDRDGSDPGDTPPERDRGPFLG
jgi:hypothetical protein